jgi:peptidoglycan/xylan/chitin deacetylase (PgdA/CDA1 family)
MVLLQTARGYLSGAKNGGMRRSGVRVFCYHGVVEDIRDSVLERNFDTLSDFREHIAFLRKYRVLTLEELRGELLKPVEDRRPKALITFDDGYANNVLAAEVLSRARLPWVVFVTTGAVGQGRAIWTVELSLLLLHGRAARLEVCGRTWSLLNRAEREQTFGDVRHRLKSLPSEQRREIMECIRAQFPSGELQRLLDEYPSFRMLSWEEVTQLALAGVGIGSHGVYHEIHHDAQPREVCRRELRQSKAELEEKLGVACDAFAYPNGNANADSEDEVREAAFDLAFTMLPGTVGPNAKQYLLPRLTPPGPLRNFARTFYWEAK